MRKKKRRKVEATQISTAGKTEAVTSRGTNLMRPCHSGGNQGFLHLPIIKYGSEKPAKKDKIKACPPIYTYMGKMIWTSVPLFGLLLKRTFPRCASMIRQLTVNPNPVPFSLEE